MNHPSDDKSDPPDVKFLQDCVIQMRHIGTEALKRLLVSELQARATNLAEAKIDIPPRQRAEALENVPQVDLVGTALRGPQPNRTQQMLDRTNLLQRYIEATKKNSK